MTIENNQELVSAETRVQSIEQKIAFRQKGNAGKYINELAKAKSERSRILSDINRENNKDTIEETDAFIKDFNKKERLRKEKEEAITLFKKYKENPPIISVPIKEQKEMPNFDYIGVRIKKIHQKDLKQAQTQLDHAVQKSSKSSPVSRGKYTGQLQRARNHLNLILKGIEHEAILIEYRELRAEKEWLETIKEESEAEIEEVRAIINEHKRNIALFEKHGLNLIKI